MRGLRLGVRRVHHRCRASTGRCRHQNDPHNQCECQLHGGSSCRPARNHSHLDLRSVCVCSGPYLELLLLRRLRLQLLQSLLHQHHLLLLGQLGKQQRNLQPHVPR